jgi:hypothetical protein
MIRFLSLLGTMLLLIPAIAFAGQDISPVAPAKFFSSMQDIPLVPGITELSDQAVTFDKPQGRIVESVAEIETGNPAGVKKAYEDTLPQLGWRRVSDNSYARAGESLILNFEKYEGRNFVRIMVRPRGFNP